MDGRTIECDAVLIGIGVRPALGWLVGSGLETETAIPVDAGGRTAIPEVFAAGDVAAPLDPSSGRHVRSEHWEAAARQGMAAARGMLGLDPVRSSISSFWSDQYGLRIQYLGDARAADAMSVDGEPSSRDFAAWFTRAGDPVAALLVGRPHALAAARRRIELSRQRNRPLNEGGVDEALVAAGG